MVLHLKQPGWCCRLYNDTEQDRTLLDVQPDEPNPHQSFGFGLPKASLRVAYLQLEYVEPYAFTQFQPLSSPTRNQESNPLIVE